MKFSGLLDQRGQPCEIISEGRIYIQCDVAVRLSLGDVFILTRVHEKSCTELSLKFQPASFIRRLLAASSQRWTAAYRGNDRRERREESRCWRNVTYGTDVSATDDSDLSRRILSNVISPALRITRIIVLQIPCI